MADSELDGGWPNVLDTIQQHESHNNRCLSFAHLSSEELDQLVETTLTRSDRRDI